MGDQVFGFLIVAVVVAGIVAGLYQLSSDTGGTTVANDLTSVPNNYISTLFK